VKAGSVQLGNCNCCAENETLATARYMLVLDATTIGVHDTRVASAYVGRATRDGIARIDDVAAVRYPGSGNYRANHRAGVSARFPGRHWWRCFFAAAVQTILASALPTIASSLGGLADVSWVVLGPFIGKRTIAAHGTAQ